MRKVDGVLDYFILMFKDTTARHEAEAAVAYLKWMSSVDSNGFPDRFGAASGQ